VLRNPQALATQLPNAPHAASTVGVSAGTAAVLGLRRIRQMDPPTTAYLMVGESCAQACTFCTQARQSTARPHFLSRVAWPVFPRGKTVLAIARSFAAHCIVRCCLQVTLFPGYLSTTLDLVRQLRCVSDIPICVSVVTSNLEDVGTLLTCGAERVTLALDSVPTGPGCSVPVGYGRVPHVRLSVRIYGSDCVLRVESGCTSEASGRRPGLPDCRLPGVQPPLLQRTSGPSDLQLPAASCKPRSQSGHRHGSR